MAKPLVLYNTMSRSKEEFSPLKKGEVGMYSCGPTVYHYAHIGNLRSFVFADTLKRVLRMNEYAVQHIINITDVGHLTDDADAGEDKMEKGARREGKSVWDIAKFYTDAFMDDIHALNVEDPDIWCKATEHIQEQIAQVQAIQEAGYTYETEDGIYFDTTKLEDYSKLARLKPEDLKAGSRVDMGGKKHKTDFALWKHSPTDKKRAMEWESPWGTGFPGWHIECSAMSSHYLGEQFDIHTGGIDHIPVHHTNEIAQAECAFGLEPWVKYWLHGEFLILEKGKMAKSAGNFLTLQALSEKFDPLSFRYLCLTAHYRQQLKFSDDAMASAQASYERLKNIVVEVQEQSSGTGKAREIENYVDEFQKAIDDDLNTPQALAVLWNALRDRKLSANEKLLLIEEFDEVFGLRLLDQDELTVPEEVQRLVDEREQARKEKDWAKADELRERIKKLGYALDDRPEGCRVKKVRGRGS